MDRALLIELFGYLGSLLVVVSMLMSSVKRLRIVNTVGSVIFAIYALIIRSYPTAFMNFALVIINVVNLVKLIKAEKTYNVMECYKDESFVQLYLKENLSDIKKFFPEFSIDEGGHIITFIVCSGSTPIGITIGNINKDLSMQIELDYTIPSYRDCSVGKFLYSYIAEKWNVNEFIFKIKTVDSEKYFAKTGFTRDEQNKNTWKKVIPGV